MAKSLSTRKSQAENARANSSNSQLRLLLMITIAICLMVSVYVNIAHSHPSMMPDSSVYQAMEDFKRGFADYAGSYKLQALSEVNEGLHVQEPPIGNAGVDSAKASFPNGGEESSSEIAKLSCTKHGGPEDEFAQEMVYWEDIPSDARYVSPLKAKKGGQRLYMTFEVSLGA